MHIEKDYMRDQALMYWLTEYRSVGDFAKDQPQIAMSAYRLTADKRKNKDFPNYLR